MLIVLESAIIKYLRLRCIQGYVEHARRNSRGSLASLILTTSGGNPSSFRINQAFENSYAWAVRNYWHVLLSSSWSFGGKLFRSWASFKCFEGVVVGHILRRVTINDKATMCQVHKLSNYLNLVTWYWVRFYNVGMRLDVDEQIETHYCSARCPTCSAPCAEKPPIPSFWE
jgi:hypothetical protein